MVFQLSGSVPIQAEGYCTKGDEGVRCQRAVGNLCHSSSAVAPSWARLNVGSLLSVLTFSGGGQLTVPTVFGFSYVCTLFPVAAVPPLATNTVSPSLALLANNLSMPTSDLPPGASPRKKPRKQQHVISTEEGDMMETNSTDDEKSTAKSLLVKAEKRKSPPKEYIGNAHLS